MSLRASILAAVTSLVVAGAAFGCGSSNDEADSGTTAAAATAADTTADSSASDNEGLTVGLVLGNASPFYSSVQAGAQAEADKLGVALTVQAPQKYDPVLQTPMVDALTARRVDAMVVSPTDPKAMIGPLQRANDAGIPVVTIDTPVGDGDYEGGDVSFPVSLITSDNAGGGQTACEALIKEMGGRGKIFVEDVQPGVTSSDDRFRGCKRAVDATDGSVKIVGHGYCNEDSSKAAADVAAALQRDPDITGIFGTDGYASDGVVQAVRQANVSDDVAVAYFDARKAGADALREGIVDLLIAQQTTDMGAAGVRDAVAALNDEEVERLQTLGVKVITRENVDEPANQALIYG
ncbi:ABC transporter substrate-binding protein [Conexibacter sp. CPCC 206217]|uniref:ABC transporter substrate-binding protein n=1 Tax=Conexibacter sp. CPCC 206217 TaxID=3064574 RepID=UPI002718D5E4|nr:ABC transporter substrate-binding protein [Conexibacter sp. CPCC 206217]MDO8209627.1 ABC transporter substrate-binding protein [Conexibacter sp. CPCC 206217]